MNSETQDFLLHLYDKLWSLVSEKEKRLWTFLSVYGAAIGLVYSAGKFTGNELYTSLIVLALTLWAVLLIIDADWWSKRNRMLVKQIENQFSAAVTGIIPSTYHSLRPRGDSLYKTSILILLIVAILTYTKTASLNWKTDSLNSMESIVVHSLLYLFFVGGVIYCVHKREQDLRNYFTVRLTLFSDIERMTNLSDHQQKDKESLSANEAEMRKDPNWRYWGLGTILFVTMLFYSVFLPSKRQSIFFISGAIVLQLLACCIYVWSAYKYTTQNLIETKLEDYVKYHLLNFNEHGTKITIGVWILSIVLIICSVLSRDLPIQQIPPPTELTNQVERLTQKVESLRESSLEERAEHVRVLDNYLKSEEAGIKFLSKEEAASKFVTREEYRKVKNK
jgi:hypothetical protein